MPSFTYAIVKLILTLKGVKKDFSKDPIDVNKIRKEDVLNPKGNFYKEKNVRKFKILKTRITEVGNNAQGNKLILFIHGGAFISGPAKHHWDSLKKIVQHSNSIVWMCDYPKAPEHKIQEISEHIDALYDTALTTYPGHEIICIGDSVGGTLITSLTQRLVQKGIKLPHHILLVTPVMDATMTNPAIAEIDKTDPMLSKAGVLSAKKLCAGTVDLQSPMISPLYGSFDGFPKTTLFAAENDIMYPDQLLAIKKMEAARVDIEVIEGKDMPHIWPFLPVMKEANIALKSIIEKIQ